MKKTSFLDLDIILLQESIWESILSDIITFTTVGSLIGLGVLLESSAMQWAGFVMASISIAGRVSTRAKDKKHRHTPQQAADYLKEKYGVVAFSDTPGRTAEEVATAMERAAREGER